VRKALGISLLLLVALPAVAQFEEKELADRRARLLTLVGSDGALVMKASDGKVRSNDTDYRYRQESNFLYLTGINEPGWYLVLAPRGVGVGGKRASVVALGPGRSTAGRVLPDGIVVSANLIDDVLDSLGATVSTLYVSAPEMQFTVDWLNDRTLFLDRDMRKAFEQKHQGVKVKSPAKLFGKVREVKSASELALMEKAVSLTAAGLRHVLRVCKPGMYEYELQAAIEYEATRGGADFMGWPCIVGSGPNSLILHYDDNRRQMQAGDVVVLDIGAECGGYTCDITRTYPVSGKYSREQKEIYSAVLAAQDAVFRKIKAGVPFRELEDAARDAIAKAGFEKYIRHGVSHNVGLDVHDISSSDTLRAGMVITVEPGIYVPVDDKERPAGYRGVGVRIEDDVLVTEEGGKLITGEAPRGIPEIEKLMRKK
jgi:Xaa-Pro aminopeptidase